MPSSARPLAPVSTGPFPGPGEVLGDRYELVHEIGRGGYSVVFFARDRSLGTDVAVKLLVPPPAVAHQARERMRREARAVRGLTHPSIVALHDFLEQDGWNFLVMEYVDGLDLSAVVEQRGPLPVDQAAGIGRDVAEALAAAHRKGILHRDVKPHNVLVDAEGRGRLTDFGSARLEGQATMTHTGGVVGTLAYAPPEILAGRRGDARSDVYALGLTVFYGLTGSLPPGGLLGPGASETGFRPSVQVDGIPGWMDDIVARATRSDPGDRFPTAGALGEALSARGEGSGALVPVRWSGRCLICGDGIPEGTGVCPACAAASAGAPNRLVFLDRPGSRTERRERLRELEDRVGQTASVADLTAVASGVRPLVRAAEPISQRAAEALVADELPAVSLTRLQAAGRVPPPFLRLLSAIVGVGVAAWWTGGTFVALTSPVIAGLLWLAAFERVRHPAITVSSAQSALPEGADATAVEALANMPPGAGADLLSTVLRLARAVAAAPATEDMDSGGHTLGQVVEQGAALAVEVSRLDRALAVLDRTPVSDPADQNLWDVVTRAQRTRDQLVQQLLEAIASLGRAHHHLAESEARLAAIDDAARELEEDAAREAAAAREIEALLAGPS